MRNRERYKTCDVQVSVILSGAKDHDFRFFGLRPQNDNDKERLAHSVKTILFCFAVFFLSFFFPILPAPIAAAQEDSQTEIRFQKILADLRKSSDALRKRNDFFRRQDEILRAKILPSSSADLRNSDEVFILQLNEQRQKLKAQNNALLDQIAQKEQEDLQAQSKLKDFRERIMNLKEKMLEEKRLNAQIASWQKQKKYLQEEVLKSMQTMVKLEKQKDKLKLMKNSNEK